MLPNYPSVQNPNSFWLSIVKWQIFPEVMQHLHVYKT